jgi:hypothetical protein
MAHGENFVASNVFGRLVTTGDLMQLQYRDYHDGVWHEDRTLVEVTDEWCTLTVAMPRYQVQVRRHPADRTKIESRYRFADPESA